MELQFKCSLGGGNLHFKQIKTSTFQEQNLLFCEIEVGSRRLEVISSNCVFFFLGRLILLTYLRLSLVRVWVASLVWTKVDSEHVGVLLWLRVMIYGEL